MMVKKSSGLLHMMRRPPPYDREEPSRWIVPVKEAKRPRQQKEKQQQQQQNETAINSQFMHANQTRI